MDITITPIVTEKATKLTEKLNRYTFRVSPQANKAEIKSLVEKLYGVKVVSVNTAVVRGKNKSRWTKSGLLRGKSNSYKKAFITVGEGQTIDFYSNI
ncbi:50S ribosomal protein L23 [Paramuribaculum intestinale]|jgi:large subunit ribosomal protein L23|uniref:Large ribosomal subunit protein uL23 n=1 Tax=Paramuribaculum intestinale TaxID=2094151 RepID=A0A2V1IRS8_9BACT|nr:50S ribosomal protein L23 [Paramuribaculum intestinale]MBJ2185577.1 50S ribosomal protein L23 [Muribaculaceae bacterium]MDE5719861.1 50S ribosomal protein L23 [Paramuribaculum sp.]ROS91608.1 50S ribosomal protein L23 [Muribaculaceae bacterium Isolate-043 (Harlan)]ROT17285.1 50S ribosomal protein L23 [Muribaculaceae bacterium Isolate-105 (HZI)]RXE62752.1 50S ribosomal protein L23 [Muribaculaceae bacterium Isolate-004 (NCI)]